MKANIASFVLELETERVALLDQGLPQDIYMCRDDELEWERDKILNFLSHPEQLSSTQRFLLDNNLWRDETFRTLWADKIHNFNSPREELTNTRKVPPEVPTHVQEFFAQEAEAPVHWDIWSHQWLTWETFYYRYSKRTATERRKIGGYSDSSLKKAWGMCPPIAKPRHVDFIAAHVTSETSETSSYNAT